MPGSKTTFRYTLVPRPDDVARVQAKAAKILGWACDGDTRITCHQVTGDALGVVTLSMTIHGRDRWWATQLAQDILDGVLLALGTDAPRLDLHSQRQDPHDHRGYGHGRTKRYRERRRTQDSGEGSAENGPDPGSAGGDSTGATSTTTSA